MSHLRAENLHLHRELAGADRLERLASRPLEPRRAQLLSLAVRVRAIEASRVQRRADVERQLDLFEAAAAA